MAQLIINPKSYAQTVENLFYLSNAVTNKVVRRVNYKEHNLVPPNLKPQTIRIRCKSSHGMMFHSTLRNQALPQNAHCCIRADMFANTLHGWAFWH